MLRRLSAILLEMSKMCCKRNIFLEIDIYSYKCNVVKFINDQISMLDNISFRYRTWVFKVNFSFEIQNLGIINLCTVAFFYINFLMQINGLHSGLWIVVDLR